MDRQELITVLREHHADCFGWALLCCRGHRQDAEDVLQTVYLKILDGKATFNGNSEVKSWLLSVVRNTACDVGRRWMRQLRLIARLSRGSTPSVEDSATEERIQRREAQDELRLALGLLSTRQREVLHLVFYQDVTLEEAAKVLRISLGSARTHYHRGKRRLSGLLQDKETANGRTRDQAAF